MQAVVLAPREAEEPATEPASDVLESRVCTPLTSKNVPPTRQYTNPNLLVIGIQVVVQPVHAKVRRDGYRRNTEEGP